MNPNQLVNMIVRMVMRRLINTGVNKGIDLASRRRGASGRPDGGTSGPGQGADGRETSRRARQALRLMRRFGRF
ncbi:hypothetical protein U879_13015 [Defluviimonas sp. 20V17]|uniref:Uncharacterized protein n=1 Tax=Allgaiera indica TaxID=765699 RepID=A0AAN4UQD0_9RHOB|nr:hypothetical protein [Allgaiera indica]KDB03300.1 hypothetical protein U879_13015 [Defluviimonas sp. 20V17]GHE00633.1 hypothetical protein GCM10008024_12930 [Allgaiera indica]SDW58547.1 hypothetical protein SAMN05444006_10522 [Allgaiera indica]